MRKKRTIPNGYIRTISQAILYLNGIILLKLLEVVYEKCYYDFLRLLLDFVSEDVSVVSLEVSQSDVLLLIVSADSS